MMSPHKTSLIHLLLLLIVLGGAAYFRVVGLFWGEYQYLHPDERFLVWVGSDITPLKCTNPQLSVDACPSDKRTWMGFREYFDAATSTLNPNNRGHGFYVYGTLPMFITRYAVQWIFGHSGFMEMTQVGRALSALFDLLTVALVYAIATRLYDRRVGLLAAAFSGLAVLQIQQSHFFTMDTFVVFFLMLALYIAIRAQEEVAGDQVSVISDQQLAVTGQHFSERINEVGPQSALSNQQSTISGPQPPTPNPSLTFYVLRFTSSPLFLLSLLFGLALGMAVASKLNAAPMAVVLPLALGIGLLRYPAEERSRRAGEMAGYLVLAALVSLVVFRLAQPYAFSGPGFFGLKPNPEWIRQIREQRVQSSGDVDMPPNMQWARRNVLFSGLNLTVWGLGLPLGLLAWAGFLWMAWRMVTGEWRRHLLLWGWTAAYFAWQSTAQNPTMRYQLPVYPTLAIIAAWGVFELLKVRKLKVESSEPTFNLQPSKFQRASAFLIGGAVLLLTFGWAWAFTRIYTRPVTRVEATRWMFDNIPGPITLAIDSPDDGAVQQLLPFPYKLIVRPGSPFNTQFEARASGTLSSVILPHIADQSGSNAPRTVEITITDQPAQQAALSTAVVRVNPADSAHPLGPGYTATLDRSVALEEGKLYYLNVSVPGMSEAVVGVCGPLIMAVETPGGPAAQTIDTPAGCTLSPGLPQLSEFAVQNTGTLAQVFLPVLAGSQRVPDAAIYELTLRLPGEEPPLASTQVSAGELIEDASLGSGYRFTLDSPVEMYAGEVYQFELAIKDGGSAVTLYGAGIANESDWDDGLPLRMEGYDPYGGIYPQDLVLQMYWDDNLGKRNRFETILNSTDFLSISSNRQWGSLPRLPERFPMTIQYYRELIGCPAERSVEWCYSVAEPGTFQGRLGFDLVEVFDSYPSLGMLEINDQFAEEAFTVYDHPKVLVFRKATDYDSARVAAVLESIDLSQVVRVLPIQAKSFPGNLMLPAGRLEEQRQGGTWSELFNTNALYNRYPGLAAILWYLAVAALGILAYPLVRLALPGLPDRGYPLARTAGLLIVAWLVWVAGSSGIPFERGTITAAIALLGIAGLVLTMLQWDGLRAELRSRGRYFLTVEGLFLAFFLFDLMIRIINPDLWHPYKGGEKPMDFAYFNAILKSTTFPPYDPWYAGGYLNYYYYGFVLVGALVKWLGIIPAVAYNLILPTLFSLIALGAFSIAWNILGAGRRGLGARTIDHSDQTTILPIEGHISQTPIPSPYPLTPNPWLAGIAAALLMAVLGNLGTVRMIWQGYQRLSAPGGQIEEAGFLTRLEWAASGFSRTLAGESLPYYPADWYWLPSRAIPGQGDIEPITEFPFFTVLYADPHAHLYALPVTLLALSVVLGIVLNRGAPHRQKRWWAPPLAALFLGGLAIGGLRPTNTWDFYPYLALAVVALAYRLLSVPWPSQDRLRQVPLLSRIPTEVVRFLLALAGAGAVFLFVSKILDIAATEEAAANPLLPLVSLAIAGILALGAGVAAWTVLDIKEPNRTGIALMVVATAGAIVALTGLAFGLYAPFGQWYGQAYNEIMVWTGPTTPLGSYLVHWGLFLFVLVSWMSWETHEWMASTPLRAMRRLAPYRGLILGGAAALLIITLALALYGVPIALLALPLAAWAGVLLLRPGLPDVKRFVLFLIGTGLVMTLFVEVFVLRGDIGRMNTVFKFYLQVWTLFAVCSAASLGWLLPELARWLPGWRNGWTVALTLLFFGAALFPLLGGVAKLKDRMAPEAPVGLDGMAFIPYATFDEPRPDGQVNRLDLSEDFRGIRWMQETIQGSPVIVEANSRNLYRWFGRYSIYTGLPSVVGWEWHQLQQRAITQSNSISNRVTEVSEFYNTLDIAWARQFLDRYDVSYIILGPLERTAYAGPGLDKFKAQEGQLWRAVYSDGQTTIYEVIREDDGILTDDGIQ